MLLARPRAENNVRIHIASREDLPTTYGDELEKIVRNTMNDTANSIDPAPSAGSPSATDADTAALSKTGESVAAADSADPSAEQTSDTAHADAAAPEDSQASRAQNG